MVNDALPSLYHGDRKIPVEYCVDLPQHIMNDIVIVNMTHMYSKVMIK